jgi:hypothetical protein
VQRAAEAADLRFALVGVDASAGMIERARAKTWPAGYGSRLVGPRGSHRHGPHWLDDHIDESWRRTCFGRCSEVLARDQDCLHAR